MKYLASVAILAMISIPAMAATSNAELPAPTFTGKCEVNFDSDNVKAELRVVPGTTGAICIPAGWKIQAITNTNRTDMGWKTAVLSIRNVVLIQPQEGAQLAKWWIYPVTEKGESPLRYELVTKVK